MSDTAGSRTDAPRSGATAADAPRSEDHQVGVPRHGEHPRVPAESVIPPVSGDLLAGRTALVSGIGPGMGRDIAIGLAAQGADVALLARSDRSVPQVAREVEALGRRALQLRGSVTSAEDCERVATEVADAFDGRLDILVNSAFDGGHHGPFEEADLERWQRPIKVNYLGTLRLTQALLPLLKDAGNATGDARIVMVNTMSTQRLEPEAASYAASKAALSAATKTLALELGAYGIRVNAVHPGYIWGDSVKIYFDWQAEQRGDADWTDIYRERAAETALGYLPHSSEIARSVVYLASPLASCVTGVAIPVNAGHWVAPSA